MQFSTQHVSEEVLKVTGINKRLIQNFLWILGIEMYTDI